MIYPLLLILIIAAKRSLHRISKCFSRQEGRRHLKAVKNSSEINGVLMICNALEPFCTVTWFQGQEYSATGVLNA